MARQAQDGFGVLAVEAMAATLPVVASDSAAFWQALLPVGDGLGNDGVGSAGLVVDPLIECVRFNSFTQVNDAYLDPRIEQYVNDHRL